MFIPRKVTVIMEKCKDFKSFDENSICENSLECKWRKQRYQKAHYIITENGQVRSIHHGCSGYRNNLK